MSDAVALLLDPEDEARDGAIMAACLAAQHFQRAHHKIILAADALASLEVALAISAHVEERTVEDGEREPDPIVAIHLFGDPENQFERELTTTRMDEAGAPLYGSVSDLSLLGLFSMESLRVSSRRGASRAIRNSLWQFRPRTLIVLASRGSGFWENALEYSQEVSDCRLFASQAVGLRVNFETDPSKFTTVDSEWAAESVGDGESSFDDLSLVAISEARRAASIAAGLIEALVGETDSRTRMGP